MDLSFRRSEIKENSVFVALLNQRSLPTVEITIDPELNYTCHFEEVKRLRNLFVPELLKTLK